MTLALRTTVIYFGPLAYTMSTITVSAASDPRLLSILYRFQANDACFT